VTAAPVIYEPKGAAREYAELACNLRLTCSHACTYCYCPGCLHKSREAFFIRGPARVGILDGLRRDADRMAAAGDRREVMFSFVGDPFAPEAVEDGVTLEALRIMVERGLQFSVITKGGTRALAALYLLRQGGRYGTSLLPESG